MKKKYIWLLSCVVLLTGCGNRESLVCTSTTESDEATSYATLDIDIKDNKIYDMEFTVDMEFPEEYTSQLRTIASNIQASKPYMEVYIVDNKIRMITTGDRDDSFLGIKIDQEITYGELKEVLELQGYTCE